MISKEKIEGTESLREAVIECGIYLETDSRFVLPQEEMDYNVAQAYDQLGRLARKETYKKIAQDFMNRVDFYDNQSRLHTSTIFDVGCGSGLLSIELAESTGADVRGIDLSPRMIELAEKNLEDRSKQRVEEIKEFWKKLPEHCKPTENDYKKLETDPPLYDQIRFKRGSVYNLWYAVDRGIDYIVCRNALHRFHNPKKVIERMYDILMGPSKKMYIRDLRRDADWKTIVKRIGEERWKSPEMVEDYLSAMAAMLTTKELEVILNELNIKDYSITSGGYILNEPVSKLSPQIEEFADEVEYVCVITKQ